MRTLASPSARRIAEACRRGEDWRRYAYTCPLDQRVCTGAECDTDAGCVRRDATDRDVHGAAGGVPEGRR